MQILLSVGSQGIQGFGQPSVPRINGRREGNQALGMGLWGLEHPVPVITPLSGNPSRVVQDNELKKRPLQNFPTFLSERPGGTIPL